MDIFEKNIIIDFTKCQQGKQISALNRFMSNFDSVSIQRSFNAMLKCSLIK